MLSVLYLWIISPYSFINSCDTPFSVDSDNKALAVSCGICCSLIVGACAITFLLKTNAMRAKNGIRAIFF